MKNKTCGNWLPFLLVGLALSLGSKLIASDGAENLVLVVNQNETDSLAIANHYIQLRQVPPSNVIYLDFELQKESVGVQVFKDEILKPVIATINERQLQGQIDYIVYSSGFPTRISEKQFLDAWLEENGKEFDKKLHEPWCSINALTYFGEMVLENDLSFFELDSNQYFRRPIKAFFQNPFFGKTKDLYDQALSRFQSNQFDKSLIDFRKLTSDAPNHPIPYYQLARIYAASGKIVEAITELEKAVHVGWCYRSITERDPAFAALRTQDAFNGLLERMPDEPAGMLPTRKFDHQISWAENGWPAPGKESGERYYISTVLGISESSRGTASLVETLNQMTRTAKADFTNPEGTFFFADHNNVRSKVRSPQFPFAVEQLKKLGFKAKIITTIMPENEVVLGATLGSSKIPWVDSGSTFAPGAICDNLTSVGGLFTQKQTLITDYIKYGAGGASGSVHEPYAIAAKFPHAMIQVHYARGCTLGEAFYQSIASPRYMLIVGDPLCRPFAELPQFEVSGLKNGQSVGGTITVTAKPNRDGPAIAKFQIYLDGSQIAEAEPGEPIELSGKILSPGFHQLSVVGVADTLIGASKGKTIGFNYEKGRQQIEISRMKSGPVQLSDTITIRAETNVGNNIVILQNSRVLAEIRGKSGKATIPAKTLGRGMTQLRAVTVHQAQKISSSPMNVEVNP